MRNGLLFANLCVPTLCCCAFCAHELCRWYRCGGPASAQRLYVHKRLSFILHTYKREHTAHDAAAREPSPISDDGRSSIDLAPTCTLRTTSTLLNRSCWLIWYSGQQLPNSTHHRHAWGSTGSCPSLGLSQTLMDGLLACVDSAHSRNSLSNGRPTQPACVRHYASS